MLIAGQENEGLYYTLGDKHANMYFKGGGKDPYPTKYLQINSLTLVTASATVLSCRSQELRRWKGAGCSVSGVACKAKTDHHAEKGIQPEK